MAQRTEQRRLVFSGQVQGVGFRWTARSIAAEYAVTGWVCNCPDGTVELVAEGKADELDAFLDEVRAAMSRCIRRETCQIAPAAGLFSGFEIRY